MCHRLPAFALLAVVLLSTDCKSAASADAVAIDLTNAVCAPLEGQPVGQPWIDFVCTIAQGVEQGIGALSTDGGALATTASPPSSTKTVTIRVPINEASGFMASHRSK